jgi:predicted unusual protein kinase regulating ubiquinone biosynthesis (AarF/ABC1/UbiB family)
MFDQLFTNGFFHADPHPGNIFVTPLAPVVPLAPGDGPAGRSWKLTFIDFGMMGEVPASTRSGLRKLLIAAASRDGKGLVDAMRDVGVLLPSAETTDLERAMTQLFARFGGMGFAELREVDPREFRDFAVQFGDVVRSLPFQLPENFLLIIRAMSLTSGVCSALDPEFNLWDSVEPYAAQLIRDERGNVVQDLAKQALEIAGVALRLPKRLDSLADRLEDGSLAVTSPRLEQRVARLERTARRLIAAVLFGGLLIAGAVVRADDAVLGTVLMAVSAVPLLYTLFGGRRSR